MTEVIANVEGIKIREDMLNALTPKERKVFEMRVGLDGYTKRPYREIGDLFNITSSRASQIYKKTIRKLRHPRFIRQEDFPFMERDLSHVLENRRLINCLDAEGIKCLNDFKKKKFETALAMEAFLIRTNNLGRKSIMELKDFLAAHNLSFEDFKLSEEEVKEKRILDKFESMEKRINDLTAVVRNDSSVSAKRDIDEIKRVLNDQFHRLKRFEEHFHGSDNGMSDHCRSEIQTFKNEMAFVSQEIQRSINKRIMEFNEFMAVERYKIEKLLYRVQQTG